MAQNPVALPTLNIGPSAAYVQSQRDFKSAQVDANQLLRDMLKAQEGIAVERKQVETQIGESEAAARAADQQQAQVRADAAKEVQARFGGNAQDPASVASRLALSIREESDKANSMLEDIRRRSSTSVLDDPLSFIINAIELPQIAADYNTRATKIDSMNADLKRIEARSAAQTTMAHATIPAISTEQAAAAAKKSMAEAARRNNIIDLELINTRVSYAQQAMANTHQYMMSEQGLSAQQMTAASANFQSRIEAIKWAESSTRREAETARATEMLTDLNAKKQAIAIAAAAYGHDPKMFTMSMFERLPAKEQFRFMSGAMAGNYGVNPYDAWKNINTFGGPNLPATTREWQRQITGLVHQITSSVKPENIRDYEEYNKDKEGYVARRLTERLVKLATEPVTEATSFLKELPPAVMAGTFTNFNKSVAGTVLAPLMTVTNPTTATVVETIATGLAAKGVPTTGQAYAIAQYYAANVAERNKQSNAAAFKVELPRSYSVVLTSGNRSMTVDLTKPEQVQLYLLRRFGQQGQPVAGSSQPFAETLFPGSTQPFPGSRQAERAAEAAATPPTFSTFRSETGR